MKRKFQIFVVIFILIISGFSVRFYSDKLSIHRASLQCSWTENSENARDKLDWPEGVTNTVQIRHDWIKGTLMSYWIASGIEGGVKVSSINEDIDRYWYVQRRDNFKITHEYNRETLIYRQTVEWNDGISVWVGGPCVVISPSEFEIKKDKAIESLKEKQKI